MTNLIKKSLLPMLGVVAALAALPAVADTPQIVNGGFETMTYTTVPSATYRWDQWTPTGWTLLDNTGTDYNTYTGSGGSPAGGKYLALQYLTGWNYGVDNVKGIQQTVTGLTVGNTYEIDYYAMATHDFNSARWNVSFGDVVQNGRTMGIYDAWKPDALTFVATSSSQVLTFAAEFINAVPGATPTILGIDGVSIKDVTPPVPEASSLSLLLAGLGLFGFISTRRKARAAR